MCWRVWSSCWDGCTEYSLPSSLPRFPLSHAGLHRYDARLLLESLPSLSSPLNHGSATRPSSPGGWSDLPSDAEDTFFFSAGEVEDYRREKRRRVMDRDHEARLRAIRAEQGDEEGERDPREDWGGSDEEVRFLRSLSRSILAPSHPYPTHERSRMTRSASSCAALPHTSSRRRTPPSSRCASSRTTARILASRFCAGGGRAPGAWRRGRRGSS